MSLTDFMTSLGLSSLAGNPEEYLDLSDVLDTVKTSNIKLWGMCGKGAPVTNLEFYFEDETISPTSVAVATADLTSSGGTLQVSTADYAKLKVGMILKDMATSELIQITTLTSASNIAISRGYASTTAAAHVVGIVLRVISAPTGWSAATSTDNLIGRTKWKNYVQVFERKISMPRIMKYIKSTVVPDEYAHQLKLMTESLQYELNRTLINGYASSASITHTSASGAETTYTTGGLLEFIQKTADANSSTVVPNTNATAEDISYDVLNVMNAEIIADAGPDNAPDFVVGPVDLMRYLGKIDTTKVYKSPSDRVAGYYANKFLTDLGNELEFVADNDMPNGTIVVGKKGSMKSRTLVPWGMMPVNDGTWTDQARVITVLGFEFRHPDLKWAIHSNLTTPE
jgi:hypothetical protein